MRSRRRVEVVCYDRTWPDVFELLRRVVAGSLGELALRIEHVGSTSVPGLAAKPIVDLDVVVATRGAVGAAIERLASLGYRHQGDLGVAGREAFARDGGDVPREAGGRQWPAHNLYVCAQDSLELQRHVAFRDYLRAHPAAAEEYARLKQELAETHRYDVDAYCEGKTQFVTAALAKAGVCPVEAA